MFRTYFKFSFFLAQGVTANSIFKQLFGKKKYVRQHPREVKLVSFHLQDWIYGQNYHFARFRLVERLNIYLIFNFLQLFLSKLRDNCK